MTIQYNRNERGTMANRIRLQRKQYRTTSHKTPFTIHQHINISRKCINCFPFQFSCSFALWLLLLWLLFRFAFNNNAPKPPYQHHNYYYYYYYIAGLLGSAKGRGSCMVYGTVPNKRNVARQFTIFQYATSKYIEIFFALGKFIVHTRCITSAHYLCVVTSKLRWGGKVTICDPFRNAFRPYGYFSLT